MRRLPGSKGTVAAMVLGLSLCVAFATAAWADVNAQVAFARGLVAFHGAQWSEAIAAFDQALAADSKDARARYYRALSRARAGDTRGAIEDLEQALRDQPDLPHAWLDLGIAYLSAGRLDDARHALQQAVNRGHERHVAEYFLGLVLYRQGKYSEAGELLRQAQVDPEVRLPATYYLALLAIRQGQVEEARPLLEVVGREAAGTEIGQAAGEYLAGGRLKLAPGEERRWSVGGRVAFEYDSNVTLGPSSITVAAPRDISEKSDGRAVVMAGLRYRFLDLAPVDLTGGYDLSQSVHFDLRRFDLQGHRLSLALASRTSPWAWGVGAGYNFFALDYQTFFHEAFVVPWAALQWAEHTTTQAFLNVRGRDFLRAPYDPGRDAWRYAPGLRQYVFLGASHRVLSLGYQYEIEDTVSNGPQGRAFAYKGHLLDAELQWLVADAVELQAAYIYSRQDYDNRESGFGTERRQDNAHQFAFGLRYPLADYLAWNLGYIGQRHDSNVGLFEYDRHVVSTGIQLVY